MTTLSTEPDRLPWWRYAGPWPLRPGAMAIVIALATVVSSAPVITFDNMALYLFTAAASGLAGGGLLLFAQRYLQPFAETSVGYILILSAVATGLTSIRYITGTEVSYEFLGAAGNVIASITRSMVVALIILAILGVNARRLQRQVDQTEQALSLVRAQAEALLEADETVRQQVAAG